MIRPVTLIDIGLLDGIIHKATGFPSRVVSLRNMFVTGAEGIVDETNSAFLLLEFLYKDHTPTAHICSLPDFRGKRFVSFLQEGMEYARALGFREVYSHQPKEEYNKGLRLLVGALGGYLVSRETDPERIYRIDL